MKKLIVLSMSICLLTLLSGCATPGPMGLISTHIKTPIGLNDGKLNIKSAPRTGKASCWSCVGLFAGGDNTIRAAAKNGKIKTVWYSEYEVNNVLGLYATYTVTVYGE